MSSKIFRWIFNFISSLKSGNDKDTIRYGIKSAAENQIRGCKSHFIFAGDAYWHEIALRPVIDDFIREFKINSAMVSILRSVRKNVVTKQEVEDHCKGNYEDKNSIHDDLDLFFERLRLGEEPNEKTRTYFFPKLSEKEIKFFEAENQDFVNINTVYDLPFDSFPIRNQIMLKSSKESKPEYLKCECSRQTFIIHNDEDIDRQPEAKIRK